MNRLKKYYRFIRHYDVIRTLWFCLFYTYKLGVAVYIHKKMYINVHRTARVIIKAGTLILNENYNDTDRYRLNGELVIRRQGELIIEGCCTIYEGCDINIHNGAKLELGTHTYLNRNVKINCNEHIRIGDNCAISDNVQILDSDFHTITYDGITSIGSKPIHIGNHVWIGRSAIILKGVTIGDGAIIGAGSVVTRNIPPRCLAAGNPARVIKENVEWD